MKIFNSYSLSPKIINFKAEDQQEIPIINESYLNNTFIDNENFTPQIKKTSFNTKDILLSLGFLTSAATAGVAIYKNKNLNINLKKALNNLSNAEKSQKELTVKLDEATKKAEKAAKEAADNLKKANSKKVNTITVYKDKKAELTPVEIVKEFQRLIQEKKVRFVPPQKNSFGNKFKTFIYGLKKQKSTKETKQAIQENKIDILQPQKISFNSKVKAFINSKFNRKIEKKQKIVKETPKNIKQEKNKFKSIIKNLKTLFSKNERTIFIKRTEKNNIAHKLNIKNWLLEKFNSFKQSSLTTKKTENIQTKKTNNIKKVKKERFKAKFEKLKASIEKRHLEKNQANVIPETNETKEIISKKQKNISKKSRIFAEKKKALKNLINKKRINKTGKKWARKFHLYRTKNTPKQIETINNIEPKQPKVSFKEKMKRFKQKFLDFIRDDDDFSVKK